jgi:hypothetical protein
MSHPKKDAMGRMSEQEIFRHSSEIKKSGEDWKKMYVQVHKLLETDKVRAMRSGNTLFCYMIEKPKNARVFFINADTTKNFFRNLKDFAKAMHSAGFETVYGFTDDLQTIKFMQQLGFKSKVDKTNLHAVHNQTYRVTLYV